MEKIPEILTLKEAIYYSRLSRTTIWKAIKRGLLKKCPNTGRKVLIAREALFRFLGVKKDE